jgi:uncharacterized protein YaiE (UPF0345 family)
MDILAGRLEVMLPGSDEWASYTADMSFDVPAHAQFKVRVVEPTDYCCSYIPHR